KTSLNTATTAAKTSDGLDLDKADFSGSEAAKTGIYALADADLFNILCIPPYRTDGNVDAALVAEAAVYCEKRRAMLIVDPPAGWKDTASAKAGVVNIGTNSK